MAKKVEIKAVGKYNGHNIKPNKSVDIAFKFDYSEMVNYIQLLQLLNENVMIGLKTGNDAKPVKMGMFMIKEVRVDNDGEGLIKFNSSLDYIEPESFNGIAGEILQIFFRASVEVEKDDGEN